MMASNQKLIQAYLDKIDAKLAIHKKSKGKIQTNEQLTDCSKTIVAHFITNPPFISFFIQMIKVVLLMLIVT